jgi:hypothetical protein
MLGPHNIKAPFLRPCTQSTLHKIQQEMKSHMASHFQILGYVQEGFTFEQFCYFSIGVLQALMGEDFLYRHPTSSADALKTSIRTF